MNDLVARLATGTHPVEIVLRPERTPELLRDSIQRGFVHVKFTGTRGGTELGVRLNPESLADARQAIESDAERIHLRGGLVLNYVKVQCLVDLDPKTYSGTGHLEVVEPSEH
jgi:hypothetical protein